MYRMKEKINQKRKKYQKSWKERKKALAKKKKKYRFEKYVTINKNTYVQFKRIFDKKKCNKSIAFWINLDLDKVTNRKKWKKQQ